MPAVPLDACGGCAEAKRRRLAFAAGAAGAGAACDDAPTASPRLGHAWSIPAVWEPADAAAPPLPTPQPAPLPAAAEALLGGAARAETLPSPAWTPALLARLLDPGTGLLHRRNHFVCLQIATMVGEQLAKVSADPAAAPPVFLSTLEAGGRLVGAALHYPRPRGKAATTGGAACPACGCAGAGAGALSPHLYIELICINEPGHGFGSALLQHSECYGAWRLGGPALPVPPRAGGRGKAQRRAVA
jgi:hypothetical protein